jgi:glutamate/tyrosine decarboxylase-like PLP-dependent enzyme
MQTDHEKERNTSIMTRQAGDMHVQRIPSPFELDDFMFRLFGHQFIDLAATYLDTLSSQPVYQPMKEEERSRLRQMALPLEATSPEAIIDFYLTHILPFGRHQNHPRFSAFVDPAATKMSMFAAFFSAVTNTSGSGGDYAMVYVEETVVRWLAELVGFPTTGSDGVLLGGGSDANRHGLEVARFWAAQKHGWNIREEGLVGHPRMTLYGTDQRHSSIDKAAFTLGLGEPCTVATDQHLRMDLESLHQAVQADRAAGHLPFCVVASAGTVTTGAIDPLNTLADFCEQQGMWLHIDGAFGGLGAVDPELSALYAGLERAHSLTLDPHKWLATAIGCSCTLIRQGKLLEATYKLVPSYLRFQNGKGFAGDRWYSHRSAEQTRPTSRALMTLWNIQQAGWEGIRAHIRRHIDLASVFRCLIEQISDLELIAGGPLPVVCFRVVPPTLRGNELEINRFNQTVVERLQTEGVAFLGGVDIPAAYLSGEDSERREPIYSLRYCNLNYALTEDDVLTIAGEVVRVAELCLAEQTSSR